METIHAIASQLWVVVLVLVFLGIIFYAFRPKNKGKFKDAANMIFDEDQERGRVERGTKDRTDG